MRGPGKLAAAAALGLAALAPLAAAQTDPLPSTVAGVKPSIVGIGTRQDLRRPPLQYLGTGFVVGDGRLAITNAHVIPPRVGVDPELKLVVLVRAGRTKVSPRTATVLASDRQHDLALLRFEGRPLPALEIGDSSQVREGERIAFTGFPLGPVLGLHPVTHRGIIAAITPIAIPQVSSQTLDRRMLAQLGDPYDVFQLDATAYPGNSGSPVFHPGSAAVIGIINMVFVKETKETVIEKPSGISYAIPSRYARALLRRAGQ